MVAHTSQSRAGFTLIEIVAVLVIISILSGIAYQQFSKARIHAQAAALSMDLHEMEDVIIQAVIRGDLYAPAPHGLTTITMDKDVIASRLPEGDRVAIFPELPYDLEIVFFAVGGGPASPLGDGREEQLMIYLDDPDGEHQAILDELAKMRPLTAHASGQSIGEYILMRSGEVSEPGR